MKKRNATSRTATPDERLNAVRIAAGLSEGSFYGGGMSGPSGTYGAKSAEKLLADAAKILAFLTAR